MTTSTSTAAPLTQNSNEGDRVSFMHDGTRREGTVVSSTWASFFDSTFFVVRFDDGSTARVLVS